MSRGLGDVYKRQVNDSRRFPAGAKNTNTFSPHSIPASQYQQMRIGHLHDTLFHCRHRLPDNRKTQHSDSPSDTSYRYPRIFIVLGNCLVCLQIFPKTG